MNRLIFVCVLGVLAVTSARAVEPDAVARQLTEENGLEALPDESSSAFGYLYRLKLAEELRMTDDANFDTPGLANELILAKQLSMPTLDTSGQGFRQYVAINRFEGANGKTTAQRKTLNNEAVAQQQAASGLSNAQLGNAFRAGALMTAVTAATIDREAADKVSGSVFERRGVTYEGSAGAEFLFRMLRADKQSERDIKEGQDLAGIYDCEQLAPGRSNVRYSETLATGINPNTVGESYGGFSMSTFLTGPACFMRAIGDRFIEGPNLDRILLNPDLDPESLQAMAGGFSGSLEFLGHEGSGNERTATVAVTGLDMQEALPEGGTMTINEIREEIYVAALVPKSLSMLGTMEQDGESRDMHWQTAWDDYRVVPGTALYESYRQTLKVGNVLTAAQQAEMAEAAQKLREFEQKLDAMPASQRAMMENMIGPQMEQIRSMAAGGGVEFEILTTSITVNPDLLDSDNSIAAVAGQEERVSLVRQIQKDLDALGYEPGPMSGELTPQTVNAIRVFERDSGLPETGEATFELANILTRKVLARS